MNNSPYTNNNYSAATPDYDVVTGIFCYPTPLSYPGSLTITQSLYEIGTEVTVSAANDTLINVQSSAYDATFYNVGDLLVMQDTDTMDGEYEIESIVDANNLRVWGPGLNTMPTEGTVFIKKKTKPLMKHVVTGVGTNFKLSCKAGDHLVIIDEGNTPTIQTAKIIEVEDDTTMYLEPSILLGNYAQDYPLIISRGMINGVSVSCGGIGRLMGKATAEGDVATFFRNTGLDPIVGNAMGSTFKILIQVL